MDHWITFVQPAYEPMESFTDGWFRNGWEGVKPRPVGGMVAKCIAIGFGDPVSRA